MKVYYICECCDEVFSIVDLANYQGTEQDPALTGTNVYGIINNVQNVDNSGYYMQGICPDCREEIYCGYETSFYREPVIN